jgi:PEP-CTERM motif
MRNLQSTTTRSRRATAAALRGAMPNRTWAGWAHDTVKDLGFTAAMGAASLGFGGAAVWEKQATAGIISDFGAYENYRLRGYAMSIEGGGNEGSLILTSELGTFRTGITMLTPTVGAISAHPLDARFGLNQTYAVKTNANYNTGPSYTPSAIHIHPGYVSAGQGVDFAIVTFDVPIPIQQNIVFATQRPAAGEQVLLVGGGTTGTPNTGYRPSNGDILAGFSIARSSPPLLGGSSLLYQNALFDNAPDRPNDFRTYLYDSSQGVYNMAGQYVGPVIGSSLDLSGSTSMFGNALAPEVQSFIAPFVNAVPEPSTLTLLGVGTLLFAGHRSRRGLRIRPR